MTSVSKQSLEQEEDIEALCATNRSTEEVSPTNTQTFNSLFEDAKNQCPVEMAQESPTHIEEETMSIQQIKQNEQVLQSLNFNLQQQEEIGNTLNKEKSMSSQYKLDY